MTETPPPRPMLLRPPVAAGIGVVLLAGAVLAAGLVGRAPEPARPAAPVEAAAPVVPAPAAPVQASLPAAPAPAPAVQASVPAAPVPAPAVPPTQPAALAPVTQPAPQPVPPVAAEPVKPSFDIVRVTPRGDAVIAGRAEPGAAVTVEENGKTLGTARADPQGQWVLVPTAPIAPGPGALTLSSRSNEGAAVRGDTQVAVVVPVAPAAPAPAASAPQPTPAPAPVVILTTPDAAPRVLQAPAPASPGPRLTLDVVDYDAKGEIRFAGLAAPGGVVRVYIDNQPAGDATADAQGRWGLVPGIEVAAGDHQLRIDLVGATGQVLARQELPFQRAVIAPAGSPAEAPAARVVVQPRQNLWRIARQSYGQGVRYTVIFEANRGQIRDPNLIYPGQVFALPHSTPASASTSR